MEKKRKRRLGRWFSHLRPTVRARLRVAVPYALIGVSSLVVAFILSDMPGWGVWTAFAALFVLLEFFAVEVNDRLMQSSSVMVIMTAGVIFAIRADSSAMFAMALMGAAGPLVPSDFKERRWFQPIANFGQMALSGALAGLVLDLSLNPFSGAIEVNDLLGVVLASLLAALVYTTTQNLLIRHAVKTVYGGENLEPWSKMGMLFGSQVAMGLLGGLIGAAYLIANREAILVLIVGVYGIGHMSLYAFAQLRDSHIGSLRGFVKTLEAKDMYTRGHTERVAYFAQLIGEELDFSGTQLEAIRWAALIHDLGKLAVPTELIRKRGRLDDAEYEVMKDHAHLVEEILAEVDFLQPMVEIASGHHSHFDGNGYGGRGHTEGRSPSLEACIVAVADSFDAMTSARSYRMALSQQYALGELRRHSGGQFHPEVVDAFERALNKTGRRWGAPHVNDEEMARRLAEEPELTLRG
ncbi:MAG: HD domain-containing protein [Acidimicrobiia bacterium]|nr:HD domain-containing protein [Acidimicrobiia bacterium]